MARKTSHKPARKTSRAFTRNVKPKAKIWAPIMSAEMLILPESEGTRMTPFSGAESPAEQPPQYLRAEVARRESEVARFEAAWMAEFKKRLAMVSKLVARAKKGKASAAEAQAASDALAQYRAEMERETATLRRQTTEWWKTRQREDYLTARARATETATSPYAAPWQQSQYLPIPTESATTWADRRVVDSFLTAESFPLPPDDPELIREWREFIESPLWSAGLAARKEAGISGAIRVESFEKLKSLRRLTDQQKRDILAFQERMDDLSAGVTSEEMIRLQKRAAAKIRPAKLSAPPKRLLPEVKRREAKVAEYEAEKKQELDAQEKTIRDLLARGRMTPQEASDARAAVEADRKKLATDVAIKRLENERLWQAQVAEPETPVFFPEAAEAMGIRTMPEVTIGARAAALARATGAEEETSGPTRTLADEVYRIIQDQLIAAGEQQADVTIEMIGTAAREAAERDLNADIAAITARERRFRITEQEAKNERNAVRQAHEYANERLEKAIGFARRAREIRKENPTSPPISDFEIGIALQQIGPTRIASASRFTQELRGLYEYVELPDPVTGRMERTRVPKLDEDGNPIWLGILAKYAGDPKQTGSFMGQKMRVRQSAPGAYERAERAEMSMERSMGQRARDKRVFARMVYEFNDYTDGQIDRGFTRDNVSSPRSAPRDEATIKYFMREYGFVLPEWSKIPFPRRLKSTPTDVWAAEYGLGAPKKRTKEEREAMAKARDKAAALARDMEAKIARRERKTSR